MNKKPCKSPETEEEASLRGTLQCLPSSTAQLIRQSESEANLRLFACASVRELMSLCNCDEPLLRNMIATAERFARGEANADELRACEGNAAIAAKEADEHELDLRDHCSMVRDRTRSRTMRGLALGSWMPFMRAHFPTPNWEQHMRLMRQDQL